MTKNSNDDLPSKSVNENENEEEEYSEKLVGKEDEDSAASTLISRAIELYKDDKLLEANRLLLSSSVIQNTINNIGWKDTWNNVEDKDTPEKSSESARQDLLMKEDEMLLLHEICLRSKIAHELLNDNKNHKQTCEKKVNEQDPDWISTGMYHNPFATEMSYRLVSVKNNPNSTDPSRTTSIHPSSILECQCVSVIPATLLQSLLAVLNETELYTKWIPSFNLPKFGIHSLTKLNQCGRVGQELNIVMNVPWPLKQRAVRRLTVWAFDDIDYQNVIGIKIQNKPDGTDNGNDNDNGNNQHISTTTTSSNGNSNSNNSSNSNNNSSNSNNNSSNSNNNSSNSNSKSAGDSVVDMAVDGGFLIRPCPKDHPLYIASTFTSMKQKKHSNDSPPQDQILVTFSASVDPQLNIIPPTVFNFFTKVAFKQCWKMLLQIATDVQNDKRLDHKKAIEEKKELYHWIESRLQVLLAQSSERMDDIVEETRESHKRRELEDSYTSSKVGIVMGGTNMMA